MQKHYLILLPLLKNNTEEFEDDVNANLASNDDGIDGMSINDVTISTEIVAEIEVIVDATDVEDPESAIATIETILEEEGEFKVEGEVKFITSAPTFIPSDIPSVSPTTMIPSAAPSYFGMVATVVAKSVATEELSSSRIEELAKEVAEIYGVNSTTDVQAEVDYEISGTLDVSFPKDVSDEEKIDALTEALSTSLDVHPKDIEITIDEETGEISYTISSDDLQKAEQVQWSLN